MRIAMTGMGLLLALTTSGMALAQEDEAFAEEPVAADGEVTEAPADPPPSVPPARKDGARFRFGVAGGPGLLFIDSTVLGYGGVDLRLGAQINDLIGIYVQPQLGAYAGTYGGMVGIGGLVGVSGVVDFTLADRFFVGVGGGFGVLNSPSGPEVHLRVGGYPIMKRSDERARRRGLMVGLDFRLHFVSSGGTSLTGIAPTINIGYEAF